MENEEVDFTDFENEIAVFEKQQQNIKDSLSQKKDSFYKERTNNSVNLTPFEFDPNGLPVNKWKELGLTDRQIKMIKNYEKKGGRFKKKEDLAKMYSISSEEYDILEPYIVIKSESENREVRREIAPELYPFPFDPNILSKDEWLIMGLQENTVDAIINYRDKGGYFYTNDDFRKIYTLSDEEFIILEPYIRLEYDSINNDSFTAVNTNRLMIELNSADTLDLQQLKGIGPSYARRIVKYRRKLGGYIYKEQLLEVYGMDSTRYAGFAEHIYVNTDSVKKININIASVKDMIRHPYIEFYMAKSIITYKKEIVNYTELEQIKNAKLIYDELFQKIAPYLSVEL